MEKKNLMPQQAQPIERITTGQLPDVLAELSEEALGGSTSTLAAVVPQYTGPDPGTFCSGGGPGWLCSYEGEDAE
ncbi:DUF5837 family protein [Kamptonema animale CS-326]|jgi:bacteriocin leader peptide (microcyclamide/patellamide family)|uniref:DUF5837 family cyanobactin class RiPP n=1 Tax=Kamptonema animale TaxID=92934 RepID=UPI00232B1E68|nr:DUF5837 family cyanobactin class RiPP [Kamptonema animale]MDB9513172.1 DUF5837 family protein [Kamptonema animale CS-326]